MILTVARALVDGVVVYFLVAGAVHLHGPVILLFLKSVHLALIYYMLSGIRQTINDLYAFLASFAFRSP
jgi:hypothetical protein